MTHNPWTSPLLKGLREQAAEDMLTGEQVPDLTCYPDEFLRGLMREATRILEVRSSGTAALSAEPTEWEYGTRWKLSEEAHGPDTYKTIPENSLEDARETIAVDTHVTGSRRGAVVKRRTAGPWEQVEA